MPAACAYLFGPPPLDNAKHQPSAIAGTIVTVVPQRGVMEHAADDAIGGATNVNIVVVPASHNLRHDPFQDLGSDFACGSVQHVAEVILDDCLVWAAPMTNGHFRAYFRKH